MSNGLSSTKESRIRRNTDLPGHGWGEAGFGEARLHLMQAPQ